MPGGVDLASAKQPRLPVDLPRRVRVHIPWGQFGASVVIAVVMTVVALWTGLFDEKPNTRQS